MQSLKQPFYYNKQILNLFIGKKLLNYHYYTKLIYCKQELELINQIKYLKINKKPLKKPQPLFKKRKPKLYSFNQVQKALKSLNNFLKNKKKIILKKQTKIQIKKKALKKTIISETFKLKKEIKFKISKKNYPFFDKTSNISLLKFLAKNKNLNQNKKIAFKDLKQKYFKKSLKRLLFIKNFCYSSLISKTKKKLKTKYFINKQLFKSISHIQLKSIYKQFYTKKDKKVESKDYIIHKMFTNRFQKKNIFMYKKYCNYIKKLFFLGIYVKRIAKFVSNKTIKKRIRKQLFTYVKGFKTISVLKKQKKFKKEKLDTSTIQTIKDIFVSTIYFDNFLNIEYIEDDFLFNNKLKNIIPGFSFKLKTIYFSNLNFAKLDFIEKYFFLKKHKNYLQNYLTNLIGISKNKTSPLALIPLKPLKGGFKILGLNLIGILPNNHLTYFKNKNFNFFLKKKKYNLILIPFFMSYLNIFWYSKAKTPYKKESVFKSTLFFLKKY